MVELLIKYQNGNAQPFAFTYGDLRQLLKAYSPAIWRKNQLWNTRTKGMKDMTKICQNKADHCEISPEDRTKMCLIINERADRLCLGSNPSRNKYGETTRIYFLISMKLVESESINNLLRTHSKVFVQLP